jgi:RNA polymerase sigma-70 factor (sigma-E family)
VIPSFPRVPAGPEDLSRDDAVGDLYRRQATGLVRLALLLVGDQPSAEDVVQEAFLGLYRNWPGLDDLGRVDGYLRVAVVNGSRGVLRARRRAWLRPVRHDLPVWSAEAAAMATEERRVVLAAVARLPQRQREVLALRYYAGLADTEIASVLGVSRATVSSTASRALSVLGRQLKEEL